MVLSFLHICCLVNTPYLQDDSHRQLCKLDMHPFFRHFFHHHQAFHSSSTPGISFIIIITVSFSQESMTWNIVMLNKVCG